MPKEKKDPRVGRRGLVSCAAAGGPAFRTLVVVLEVKRSYGRERFRVSPVKGEGEAWVETSLEMLKY